MTEEKSAKRDKQFNELIEAIKAVRASDCGKWLTDCCSITGLHCADGRAKRQELMRLLDQIYKTAGV